MLRLWRQGRCWGWAGPVVAGRALASLHLSLQNALWGAGCCALETAFHVDSILRKNCPFMAQRGGQFLEGASPRSKVRSCVQEGSAVVPVYLDLQGFGEQADVERVAGKVTEGNLKVDGGGGRKLVFATVSCQRAAVMTRDECGASRSVPTARSGRSRPWSHSFCFPGHVVCD